VSSSIMIPSSFADVVCSIGVSLMCSCMLWSVRGWNTVNCVFVGFGMRSLRWKNLISWLSSVCASCCSACGVFDVMISVVSSA
jgi:hypothetical protein